MFNLSIFLKFETRGTVHAFLRVRLQA